MENDQKIECHELKSVAFQVYYLKLLCLYRATQTIRRKKKNTVIIPFPLFLVENKIWSLPNAFPFPRRSYRSVDFFFQFYIQSLHATRSRPHSEFQRKNHREMRQRPVPKQRQEIATNSHADLNGKLFRPRQDECVQSE